MRSIVVARSRATGLPVTFWVGKGTRTLRQAMELRPGIVLLFRKSAPGRVASHVS